MAHNLTVEEAQQQLNEAHEQREKHLSKMEEIQQQLDEAREDFKKGGQWVEAAKKASRLSKQKEAIHKQWRESNRRFYQAHEQWLEVRKAQE